MKYQLKFKRKSTSQKVIDNKKKILRFIELRKRQPSVHGISAHERKLAGQMRNYVNPSSGSFDSKFSKHVKSYRFYRNEKTQKMVKERLAELIIALVKETRKKEKIDPTAYYLLKYRNLLNKKQIDMIEQVLSKPTLINFNRKKRIDQLLAFVSLHGRLPRQASKHLPEIKLSHKWQWICASRNSIKKEVHKRIADYHRRLSQ